MPISNRLLRAKLRKLSLRDGDILVVDDYRLAEQLSRMPLLPNVGGPLYIVTSPNGIWSIRRTRMEDNESFCYHIGSSVMCGACGYYISAIADPVTHRPSLICYHPHCPNYLKIFVLGDESRIPVFDTGRRANDPNIAAVGGTATPMNIVAGTVAMPTQPQQD